MPSFLADDDEHSAIFSNNPDILNLDPTNQFGLATTKERVNAGSIRRARSDTINESFDESSISSSHASDVSESTPTAMNGNTASNGTQASSLSSLSNGKTANGYAAQSKHDDDAPRHTLPTSNGTTTTLVDRTVPRQSHGSTVINGTDAGLNSNSTSTVHRIETPSKTRSADFDTFDYHRENLPMTSLDGTVPPPTAASSQAPSHAGSASTFEPLRSQLPAHRLSSPPVYQSSNLAASSSGLLHPPAPSPGLKHRHTLEVPRVAPSRQSRDGMDTAQASGRFSPTASPAGRRPSISLNRRPGRSSQPDLPRDEVVPDDDAARWAEAYRQKRASKRRRKEEEEDDRVLVGTKVDESHANWVTAYNMLTGIRVSVSRTNAKLDRELTDADFETKQKSTFDIAGNEMVPSAKYDFKFKDYAPWVFRRLRTLFRLDPADYLMSLTGKYILSELGSPGKSGSFFYFSRDYKYIIKTIHHAEHKFLRKILREYYEHVKENPNTLLSQFYGLHRVKLPFGKKIHFVVMNNLFPPHRDIHTTFDLKGSTVGRDYREEDLEKNPRATLKDLNWLRRKRNLELGLEKKRLFLDQLQRDVVLLKRLQIMDYSLLVGIHDVSRGNEENLRDKTLQVFSPGGEKTSEDDPQSVLLRTPSKLENARKAKELRQMIRTERPVPIGQSTDKMPDELEQGHSRPGFVFNQDDGGFRATHEDNTPAEEIYYLGVIDCLTHYGVVKKIENFWKGLSSDKTQISALPPDQYGDRFYHFIEGVTMSPEEAHREAERRDQEMMESEANGRSSNRNSRRRSQVIPPMPTHVPPPPPMVTESGRDTVDRATREAMHSDVDEAPDRVLKASVPRTDGRDSFQHEPILPVVEEAGENGPPPATPPKDEGFTPPPTRAPPPTPPKMGYPLGYTKAESADSGYEGNNDFSYGGPVLRNQISRDSLNKKLPPIPKKDETDDSGIRMVA